MPNTEPTEPVVEAKTSKLKRIKSAAITTGIYAIPMAITGGSMYFSYKVVKLQYDTAKLKQLAAATDTSGQMGSKLALQGARS